MPMYVIEPERPETSEERLEAALSALRAALVTHQEAVELAPGNYKVQRTATEAVEAARARLAAVVAAMAAEQQEATQQ